MHGFSPGMMYFKEGSKTIQEYKDSIEQKEWISTLNYIFRYKKSCDFFKSEKLTGNIVDIKQS